MTTPLIDLFCEAVDVFAKQDAACADAFAIAGGFSHVMAQKWHDLRREMIAKYEQWDAECMDTKPANAPSIWQADSRQATTLSALPSCVLAILLERSIERAVEHDQFLNGCIRMQNDENMLFFVRIACKYGFDAGAEMMQWREEATSGMRNGIDTYKDALRKAMQDEHAMWYGTRTLEEQDAENTARHLRNKVKGKRK